MAFNVILHLCVEEINTCVVGLQILGSIASALVEGFLLPVSQLGHAECR